MSCFNSVKFGYFIGSLSLFSTDKMLGLFLLSEQFRQKNYTVHTLNKEGKISLRRLAIWKEFVLMFFVFSVNLRLSLRSYAEFWTQLMRTDCCHSPVRLRSCDTSGAWRMIGHFFSNGRRLACETVLKAKTEVKPDPEAGLYVAEEQNGQPQQTRKERKGG